MQRPIYARSVVTAKVPQLHDHMKDQRSKANNASHNKRCQQLVSMTVHKMGLLLVQRVEQR